jgi:hypothetical protein
MDLLNTNQRFFRTCIAFAKLIPTKIRTCFFRSGVIFAENTQSESKRYELRVAMLFAIRTRCRLAPRMPAKREVSVKT